MEKFIDIIVENNTNLKMRIPINQITGIESTAKQLPYPYGHLRGFFMGYDFVLKVIIYGAEDLKIPINIKDYNKIMKIMSKRVLTKRK